MWWCPSPRGLVPPDTGNLGSAHVLCHPPLQKIGPVSGFPTDLFYLGFTGILEIKNGCLDRPRKIDIFFYKTFSLVFEKIPSLLAAMLCLLLCKQSEHDVQILTASMCV